MRLCANNTAIQDSTNGLTFYGYDICPFSCGQCSQAPLQTVTVYNNRLSCAATAGATSDYSGKLSQQNLMLPGNLFSGPPPPWFVMQDNPFMYYPGWVSDWGAELAELGAGLFLTGTVVALLFGTDWRKFWWAAPTTALGRLQTSCTKGMAALSVFVAAALMGVYAGGASYHTSTTTFYRVTIAEAAHRGALANVLAVCILFSTFTLAIGATWLHSVAQAEDWGTNTDGNVDTTITASGAAESIGVDKDGRSCCVTRSPSYMCSCFD